MPVNRVAAVLAFALLAAGCMDGSGGDAGGGGPTDPDAGAGKASLTVLVVDEALRPLAGAAVALGPVGLDAVTDADGLARFTGLAPGAYVVDVALAKSFPAQVAVTVAAPDGSEPKPVVVTLARDDTALAYVQVTAEDMFVEQAMTVGVDGGTGVRYSAGGVAIALPDGVPDLVQTEATWEPTQALGGEMSITYFVCPNKGEGPVCENLLGTRGASPIHVRATGLELLENGYVGDGDLSAPLWAEYTPPAGVALMLQQAVRVVTHRFYGFTPADGWTFSAGGTPDPPA